MMSGADNEPPAIGGPGKLGRGQPVAALEDFDKTPPSANGRFAKPVRPLTRDFIGSTPGKETLNFRPPQYAEMPRELAAHWASGMFDALAN
jgi:hypothetical protein